MDLKELKKIANYCKKNGIKSYKSGDVHIEFQESIQLPKILKHAPIPNPMVGKDEKGKERPPEITLDEINNWIYSDKELF